MSKLNWIFRSYKKVIDRWWSLPFHRVITGVIKFVILWFLVVGFGRLGLPFYHTVITGVIGWYVNLGAAILWGISAELGEWGVKLFDDKYAGIDQVDIIDSIVDLIFWLLGPLIVYLWRKSHPLARDNGSREK